MLAMAFLWSFRSKTYYLTHWAIGQNRAVVVVMGDEGIFIKVVVFFFAKNTYIATEK